MKIALSVDALAPSLTGIGRYTWELVQGMQRQAEISQLGYYRHGRAVANPVAYLAPQEKAPRYWPGQKWWQRHCYKQLVQSSLCHGTNYFLPKEAQYGVITVHDLSVFKYPETHPVERVREFEKLLPESVERATHIITDSEAVRQEVIEWFSLDSTKVTAIHLGVDAAFKPATASQCWDHLHSMGLTPHSYTLCVSTLEPRKRISELIKAYSLLPISVRKHCPLVLVGGRGWQNLQLLAEIESASAQGWLIYLGFVSEQQLVQLYQGARLFIYPSLYEGFGLPVAEAMACGVPVLTSNAECLVEIGEQYTQNIEIDDIPQFSASIYRSIESSKDLLRSSCCSLKSYSWLECIRKTLGVYKNIRWKYDRFD